MEMKKMNLYIITEVLYDYTDGMVVIAAADLDRCREIFAEEFDIGIGNQMSEFDEAIKSGAYKVLQVVGQSEGVVSYVYGGA
jgi:hypothetical protein